MTLIIIPRWFLILLDVVSVAHRNEWEQLEDRSRVFGFARERKKVFSCFGYGIYRTREVKRKNAPY